MNRESRHIAFVLSLLLIISIQWSCVAPNEIEILGEQQWTVFGLAGQDSAPVIFIYKVTEEQGFIYNTSAEILVTHIGSGISTQLIPVIAGEELNNSTHEFPFDEDWSGHRIYYTTIASTPLPGGDYQFDIDLGKERGVTNISLPEVVDFSNVEIRTNTNSNGNEVDRVYMSIDDISGVDLYKWEISIEQVITVNTPIEFDPVSGDPIVFEESPILFSRINLPNNYITEEKIIEAENEFKYNLSANFPDFPYTEETYLLNVRLRHYSDDLVNYFTSVNEQQAGAIFDPFIEPVFIHSNIDGLNGIIGTYAYSQNFILEYQP